MITLLYNENKNVNVNIKLDDIKNIIQEFIKGTKYTINIFADNYDNIVNIMNFINY